MSQLTRFHVTSFFAKMSLHFAVLQHSKKHEPAKAKKLKSQAAVRHPKIIFHFSGHQKYLKIIHFWTFIFDIWLCQKCFHFYFRMSQCPLEGLSEFSLFTSLFISHSFTLPVPLFLSHLSIHLSVLCTLLFLLFV